MTGRAGLRRSHDPGGPAAAPPGLAVAATVVGLVFALPLAYLVVEAGTDVPQVWDVWTSATGAGPAVRSLVLATTVTASTAVLGTGLGWLVGRTDLPGARLWRLLLALPLVIPSFIGAFALQAAFAPGGLVDSVIPGRTVGTRLEGFAGAWLVLTLFTYPYVLLPVVARLRRLPASQEESARLLGASPWRVFATVVLPQTRPAVWAGSLLVFLYTISDFGAVQLLRYDTFTRVIYASRLAQREVALSLSLLLALLAIAVVAAERAGVRRPAPSATAVGSRQLRVPLGRWRIPAVALTTATVAVALLGPVTTLVYWAARGIIGDGGTGLADLVGDLSGPATATVGVGLAGAGIAVVAVLPVAYLTVRYRSPAAGPSNALVVGGFALPGLVIALALVSLTPAGSSPLRAVWDRTVVVLLVAYLIHFGSQALRAAQVAVAGVPHKVGEAARTLGAGPFRRLTTIELPLMAPGLLAGGGLVLLSVMKELPATLLLAPPGFRTLATVIWNAAEGAFWSRAAVASLLLIAVSGVLTWMLVIRRADAVE